jgi:hypothetical protein
MKRKRFTEEQIIGVLKEAEAGVKTGDLARRHGISDPTILIETRMQGFLVHHRHLAANRRVGFASQAGFRKRIKNLSSDLLCLEKLKDFSVG